MWLSKKRKKCVYIITYTTVFTCWAMLVTALAMKPHDGDVCDSNYCCHSGFLTDSWLTALITFRVSTLNFLVPPFWFWQKQAQLSEHPWWAGCMLMRLVSLFKHWKEEFHSGARCRLTTFVLPCLCKTALVGVFRERGERQEQRPFPGSLSCLLLHFLHICNPRKRGVCFWSFLFPSFPKHCLWIFIPLVSQINPLWLIYCSYPSVAAQCDANKKRL